MSDKRIDGLEARVIELEMKAAFQEDLIAKLSEALNEHGAIIDRLKAELSKAREKLEAVHPGQVMDEKDEIAPPHY